jgi:hypothetical protein
LTFYNQQIELKQANLKEINMKIGMPVKEGKSGFEQQLQIEATSFKFGIESIEEDD